MKPEEIFVSYEELADKYGKEIKNIPLGAIGIYTFSQRIKVGLQQLMAGSRNFSLSSISRNDLMSLTEEAAKVSGISYVMDAYRKEAENVLNGKSIGTRKMGRSFMVNGGARSRKSNKVSAASV